MKLGAIMLNEKTRVSITLTTLIIIIIFVIRASYVMGGVVTDLEATDKKLEDLIYQESCSRKLSDDRITEDLNEIRPAVIEIKTKLAGIEANIEWLVNDRQKN